MTSPRCRIPALTPRCPTPTVTSLRWGRISRSGDLPWGIAYNYILSEARTKNNTIVTNGVPALLQANGRYQSDIHSLGLSWSFNF